MILSIFLTMILVTGYPASPVAVEPAAFKPVACDFFTYDNAEKILGKATGADGGMTDTSEGRKWGCTFTASDKSEKPPRLYFTIMKSPTDEVAKSVFEAVRSSNNKHTGFEEWAGVGDEAIVHTDAPNFHFVMVRKGGKTIRIKLNPADGVSLDTVKAAAVSLVPKM